MDRQDAPPGARSRLRYRPAALAIAVPLVSLPLVLAACGSGSPVGTASGGGLAKAPQALCQKLTAVFSDGPDPDADPVGYALSQILPLSQIRSSDTAAIDTVDTVVTADRALVKSNGGDHSAKAAIQKGYARLNQACPGVAP
jgi:hypothetical protein